MKTVYQFFVHLFALVGLYSTIIGIYIYINVDQKKAIEQALIVQSVEANHQDYQICMQQLEQQKSMTALDERTSQNAFSIGRSQAFAEDNRLSIQLGDELTACRVKNDGLAQSSHAHRRESEKQAAKLDEFADQRDDFFNRLGRVADVCNQARRSDVKRSARKAAVEQCAALTAELLRHDLSIIDRR